MLREEPEVLYLYFSRSIKVRAREDDQTPSDFENGFFTLDGFFYIRILDEQHEEFLQNFFHHLRKYNFVLYQRILLNLGGVLPAALEEEGYRFRSGRLAEKGFLPFEEAIGIYQYLAPQTLMGKEYKITKQRESPLPDSPPIYPLSFLQGENFFAVCLKEIGSIEMLERLQTELAGLCNQILSADLQRFDDRVVLKQAFQKAAGYLTIGLETLTKGERTHAVKLLEKYPLHLIFRVGYGRALAQKWRVEKWLQYAWFRVAGLKLTFWDEGWEGLIEGLLKKRPLFYTGPVEGAYREFQSLDDINHCAICLDQIEILDQLFHILL